MRVLIRSFVLGTVLTIATGATVERSEAQSDILLRLRSGSPAGDRVRVDSAGGFVAMGTLGIGIIPATGCGYRMMWYPFRGAFRAGTTDDGGACNYWDDANIGFYSWAGGNLTRATAFASFAFGDQVTVTAVDGAAFGASNTVSGTAGFSTGASNECSGFTCVALGYSNRAAGQGSVAIGYRVHASANYSVALGHRAHAKHTGSFTWADASTTDSLLSNGNNRFLTRAAGGYRLYTNSASSIGVWLGASGNSWSSLSDRTLKENFAPVDGEDVLRRLRNVPVSTWNFIDAGPEVRQLGPMAQDWHAAFGLNPDSLSINQAEFDGVNLAAIQALDARTVALQAHADAQAREIAELRARNEAYERRLAALEAAVRVLPPAVAVAPGSDER
jgi:trimeric autotransporter adhesin